MKSIKISKIYNIYIIFTKFSLLTVIETSLNIKITNMVIKIYFKAVKLCINHTLIHNQIYLRKFYKSGQVYSHSSVKALSCDKYAYFSIDMRH
jgi:hypothetical protein